MSDAPLLGWVRLRRRGKRAYKRRWAVLCDRQLLLFDAERNWRSVTGALSSSSSSCCSPAEGSAGAAGAAASSPAAAALPRPRLVIRLCDLVGVCAEAISDGGTAVALMGSQSFSLVPDSSSQLQLWLERLQLAAATAAAAGVTSAALGLGCGRRYERMWYVTVTDRGLGSSRRLAGDYWVGLTPDYVQLISRQQLQPLVPPPAPPSSSPQQQQQACLLPLSYDIPFPTIRGCRHMELFFCLQLGRSSPFGAGELFMLLEERLFAQNMHQVITASFSRRHRLSSLTARRSTATVSSSSALDCVDRAAHSQERDASAGLSPATHATADQYMMMGVDSKVDSGSQSGLAASAAVAGGGDSYVLMEPSSPEVPAATCTATSTSSSSTASLPIPIGLGHRSDGVADGATVATRDLFGERSPSPSLSPSAHWSSNVSSSGSGGAVAEIRRRTSSLGSRLSYGLLRRRDKAGRVDDSGSRAQKLSSSWESTISAIFPSYAARRPRAAADTTAASPPPPPAAAAGDPYRVRSRSFGGGACTVVAATPALLQPAVPSAVEEHCDYLVLDSCSDYLNMQPCPAPVAGLSPDDDYVTMSPTVMSDHSDHDPGQDYLAMDLAGNQPSLPPLRELAAPSCSSSLAADYLDMTPGVPEEPPASPPAVCNTGRCLMAEQRPPSPPNTCAHLCVNTEPRLASAVVPPTGVATARQTQLNGESSSAPVWDATSSPLHHHRDTAPPLSSQQDAEASSAVAVEPATVGVSKSLLNTTLEHGLAALTVADHSLATLHQHHSSSSTSQ